MSKIQITPISPESSETDISSDTFIEFSINSSDINRSKTKIKIDGEIAFIDSDFTKRFSGDFSLYDVLENSTRITLDPTFSFSYNKTIEISIVSEDNSGKKINKNYSFKTEKLGPSIYNSNFNSGSVISVPQILFLEFVDYNSSIDKSSLNISLNSLNIIENGSISSNYNSGSVDINYLSSSLSVRITPDEFWRNGQYNLSIYLSNSDGHVLRENIKFNVKMEKFIFPSAFPPSSFSGFRIIQAAPVGDGKSIKVKWTDKYNRASKVDSHVLTYIGDDRLKILDQTPYSITSGDSNEITLTDFTPGKQIYVLCRMLESHSGTFSFQNLSSIATDTYKIPSAVTVSETFFSEDKVLYVDDITGYPEKGLLVLENSEVVKYDSINTDENSFSITQSGRGLNGTSVGVFIPGDSVKLFLKCQDQNLNIVTTTPVFSEEYESGKEKSFIGTAVTDFSDQNKKFTQGYDYCGYHHKMPHLTLNGIDDCGTYLGGEFHGSRGFSIFDRMVAREEVLLDQTGEPCVLFKRKWSGTVCSCMNSKPNHPRMKTCTSCFGTGFVGGFDQFINKKRKDTRLQLSFGDTVEDLNLGPHQGYNVIYEPSAWALPYPTIRDRDVIIRFDYTNDLEYFYEVLDVSREKAVFLHYTRQRVRLKRLEKTDIYSCLKYEKSW